MFVLYCYFLLHSKTNFHLPYFRKYTKYVHKKETKAHEKVAKQFLLNMNICNAQSTCRIQF